MGDSLETFFHARGRVIDPVAPIGVSVNRAGLNRFTAHFIAIVRFDDSMMNGALGVNLFLENPDSTDLFVDIVVDFDLIVMKSAGIPGI